MKFSIMLMTVIALVVSASVMAEDTAETEAGSGLESECIRGQDYRTIVVVPKTAGCKIYYGKFGKTEEVGASRNGTRLCEDLQSNIRKNLVRAGFKCT